MVDSARKNCSAPWITQLWADTVAGAGPGLDEMLRQTLVVGASDLHLAVGSPPLARIGPVTPAPVRLSTRRMAAA